MLHIAKQFKFEAAHVLPNHTGKCSQLHGHSYVCEVGVTGEIERQSTVSSHGMVCDFADLAHIWTHACEPHLDHRFLNDSLPVPVTTAEWIATWIHEQFKKQVDEVLRDDIGIELLYVRVWETATSFAQVQ